MDSLDDILADYKSTRLQWALTVVSFTILVYEYILTFEYEVERFWPKTLKNLFGFCVEHDEHDDMAFNSACNIRWSSFLFFSNRYIALFGHFPVMVEFFWRTRGGDLNEIKVCNSLQMYHQTFAVVLQIIIGLSLITRIYALYECKKLVLTFYIVLTIIAVSLFIWGSIWNGINETPLQVHVPYGCPATLTANRARLLLGPWSGELLFDIWVFAMTLWKTLTLPRSNRFGLLTMIMRDGTLYFAAMATLIVGNIVTFLFGGPLSRGSATILVNAVSSTLISRLLLNLRDPKWQMDERGYDSSTINGIGFREQGGLSSTAAV